MSPTFYHHQVISSLISEIVSDQQETEEKSPSLLKTNKQDSKSIIKSEEIPNSQSVLWMSLTSLKLVKATDFCMMKRVDSPLSKLMIKKPTSNFVKLLRKLLDQTKSHTLLLTMPEPSDSHTQTLMKEIPLNTILKRIKSSAGSATNQDTSLTSLVVTTSVELDQSFTSKDIWAASILST